MTQTQAAPGTSPEPYKTSDTPYAAYLQLCGYKVVTSRQDPNDYKREVLIFVFDDGITQREDEWRSGKAFGDLKKYHRALKIVNRIVNEARKARES